MGDRLNSTISRAQLAYGPGHSAFTIIPADATDLTQNSQPVVVRAIYVGGAGNITGTVFTESGAAATVTFTGIPAGTMMNVAFAQIHATGTTATLMVGLL